MFLDFVLDECASEKPSCYTKEPSSDFAQAFVTICWRGNFLTRNVWRLFQRWRLQRGCGTCWVCRWRKGLLGLRRAWVFPLRGTSWVQVEPGSKSRVSMIYIRKQSDSRRKPYQVLYSVLHSAVHPSGRGGGAIGGTVAGDAILRQLQRL
jgi:hypothetical protein